MEEKGVLNEAGSDRDEEGSLREENCMNGWFCEEDWQRKCAWFVITFPPFSSCFSCQQ